MVISYDVFTEGFLDKVSEYEFATMSNAVKTATVDGYMKRSLLAFKHICKYDFSSGNDTARTYTVDITQADLDEIVDIVTTGMVVQWLKHFVNHQENLQNALSTRDFSTYSPAELLKRVGDAYASAKKEFRDAMHDYSYNNGDLTELHL